MSRPSSLLEFSIRDNDFFLLFSQVYFGSWTPAIYNRNYIQVIDIQSQTETVLPLPEPNEFFEESFALAFPEVLAWSAAATGIILVILIIKSFSR